MANPALLLRPEESLRPDSADAGCVSLAAIAYAFPRLTRTVVELGAAGLLRSSVSTLESFGFGSVHVAEEESPFELACTAARRLLADRQVDPESIGLLVYSGTPGPSAFCPPGRMPANNPVLTGDRFRFPATRLQFELGLGSASVLGLDQLACTGMFGAIRVARSICLSEGIDRALCVSCDFFPRDAGREAVYNCTSDAACAVLVEAGSTGPVIRAAENVTKGYYWDADALEDQIIASYFPTARHVIQQTIERARWKPSEVDWVIPHNVSLRSWEILLALAGLKRARLWSRNIPRDGHTLAGDNFINLCDALDCGSLKEGDKVLLFSYGFGAHWSGLALEV